MSDLYLQILKTQLDRFHKMLESSLPEDDEYWVALNNIDRIMAVLTTQPEVDLVDETITRLLEEAPTGDAQ